MQLPMLVTTTEFGCYIKWALMLQEQLASAAGHLSQLRELSQKLTMENQALREAQTQIDASRKPGEATSAGASGSEGASADASGSAATGDAAAGRLARDSSVPPGSSGSAAAPSSTHSSRSQEEERLLNELLNTPLLGDELLLTPNLSRLARCLEEQPATVEWGTAKRFKPDHAEEGQERPGS